MPRAVAVAADAVPSEAQYRAEKPPSVWQVALRQLADPMPYIDAVLVRQEGTK